MLFRGPEAARGPVSAWSVASRDEGTRLPAAGAMRHGTGLLWSCEQQQAAPGCSVAVAASSGDSSPAGHITSLSSPALKAKSTVCLFPQP